MWVHRPIPRSYVEWPFKAGALLGGLFASWVRTLESDAGVGAERGKRNLQTLGALIYLGCQKKYEPRRHLMVLEAARGLILEEKL